MIVRNLLVIPGPTRKDAFEIFEFLEAVLVGLVMLLFTTDCSLDIITSIDDRLENVDQIASVVADRIAESRSRWH
ncbi:hypothetical protein [Halohasta litorea]|uniref:hypothetical protein n=1 Tax=Halohasta litorea TaxID=869891 RepID=UPI002AA2B365|nr:hypothetical protein [Halohasta litorea]